MFECRKAKGDPQPEFRKCCACGVKKHAETNFYWTNQKQGRYPSGRCKLCFAAAQRVYRSTRMEKYAKYARDQRLKPTNNTVQKDRKNNQIRKLRNNGAITTDSNLVTKQWFESTVSKQINRCYYCMNVMDKAFYEHVVPVTRGGMHIQTNIVAVCGSCNSSKNDRLISEWRPWIDIPIYGLELATA